MLLLQLCLSKLDKVNQKVQTFVIQAICVRPFIAIPIRFSHRRWLMWRKLKRGRRIKPNPWKTSKGTMAHSLLYAFQILMVLSLLPEATVAPSGDQSRAYTSS